MFVIKQVLKVTFIKLHTDINTNEMKLIEKCI